MPKAEPFLVLNKTTFASLHKVFAVFSGIPILFPSDPKTKFMIFLKFEDKPKNGPHSLNLDLRDLVLYSLSNQSWQ